MARTPGSNTLVYYDFESDSGKTMVNKASTGSTYNGTFNSTPSYGTTSGGKKFFNCNDSNWGKVSLPINFGNVTLFMRGYRPNFADNSIAFGTGWRGAYGNQILLSNYQSKAYDICLGNTNYAFGNSNFSSTGWHSIIMTNNGTNSKLYIDGVLKDTKTGSSGTETINFYIGNAESNGSIQSSKAFNGYIGCLGIENKAWSDSEIQSYYNSTTWQYGLAPAPTIFYGGSPIKEIYIYQEAKDISNYTLYKTTTINQSSQAMSACFSLDGMAVIASSSNYVYQYNLSRAFDISSITPNASKSVSLSYSISGLTISEDGTKIIVCCYSGNHHYVYVLETTGGNLTNYTSYKMYCDILTSGLNTYFFTDRGLKNAYMFSSDGTTMYNYSLPDGTRVGTKTGVSINALGTSLDNSGIILYSASGWNLNCYYIANPDDVSTLNTTVLASKSLPTYNTYRRASFSKDNQYILICGLNSSDKPTLQQYKLND